MGVRNIWWYSSECFKFLHRHRNLVLTSPSIVNDSLLSQHSMTGLFGEFQIHQDVCSLKYHFPIKDGTSFPSVPRITRHLSLLCSFYAMPLELIAVYKTPQQPLWKHKSGFVKTRHGLTTFMLDCSPCLSVPSLPTSSSKIMLWLWFDCFTVHIHEGQWIT